MINKKRKINMKRRKEEGKRHLCQLCNTSTQQKKRKTSNEPELQQQRLTEYVGTKRGLEGLMKWVAPRTGNQRKFFEIIFSNRIWFNHCCYCCTFMILYHHVNMPNCPSQLHRRFGNRRRKSSFPARFSPKSTHKKNNNGMSE